MKSAKLKFLRKKKTTRRYRIKRPIVNTSTNSRIKNDDTLVVLNRGRQPVYSFTKTLLVNNVAGTGADIPLIEILNPAFFPDFASFMGLYDLMKINYVKYRFTHTTLETTDGAKTPTLYCRYVWDKDLVIATINEDWFKKQRNVVKKTFPSGQHQNSFEYKFIPRMQSAYLLDGGLIGYKPVKANWFDMESPPLHYGLALLLPALATGQNINIDVEINASFKEDY